MAAKWPRWSSGTSTAPFRPPRRAPREARGSPTSLLDGSRLIARSSGPLLPTNAVEDVPPQGRPSRDEGVIEILPV